MKRSISALMAVIFLWLAMPLKVIAEAINPPPTAEELSAAIALTGLSEDAPTYHSGMEISVNMNIQQLLGWINDFTDNRLCYVMDSFQNYDILLSDLKKDYPAKYNQMNSDPDTGIGLFYTDYHYAMEMRDEVNYYRDKLSIASGRILANSEMLQSGDCTEEEQAVYAYQIREDQRNLTKDKELVTDLATNWMMACREFERLFQGKSEPGNQETVTWLLDEIDRIRSADTAATVKKELTVSANVVRVEQEETVLTRLARLMPIGNALADSDQKMSVMVMDDKSFYIGALDGSTPLSGTQITVSAKNVSPSQQTTRASGYVGYPMRNYPSDRDGEAQVNLTIVHSGYRRLEASGIWIKKGAQLKVPMYKDDGTPYPVSWSFWGNDMLIADYEVVLSPFNDTKQEIAIKISGNKKYSLSMYFADSSGNKQLDVGTGKGDVGEKTFKFSGEWLKNAPTGGKLIAEITAEGEQKQTYQAKIKLIAPKLQKPIGDPNFKLLTTPGLSFTLPSSWPQPLGGLNISFNTPLDDKFQVRAYFDLNGNGAITIGTTAFDDLVNEANKNTWKSKDKKAMDKAVKQNEEKGRLAKAKAASGGDWAGRKKTNPFKLGSIMLSMSWFGFAQVQYRETEDHYGQILGQGGAGFTLSVTGEAGLQWPLASLMLTATLAATIFPEIGVAIDTCWPEGDRMFSVQRLDYIKKSFNVIIRLELGLTLTLGLKGFLSVSVMGLGFLEFQFRMSGSIDLGRWMQDKENHIDKSDSDYLNGDIKLALYGGAAFRVIVEILFANMTYTPFGPEWRWRLLPTPVERADADPQTPVERFLAFLISNARAEENIGKTEGAMQVDTGSDDLALAGQEIRYQNTYIPGASSGRIFSMRTSVIDSRGPVSVPVMLFMTPSMEEYNDPGSYVHCESTKHITLVGTALEGSGPVYTPIAKTEDGLGEDGLGKLTDDSYDVIDYDYWVEDVSGTGAKAYTWSSSGYKLTDVLFVVTVLAKDYEEQTITHDDGTRETRKVPVKTWTRISCYSLTPHYYAESNEFSTVFKLSYVLEPVTLAWNGHWVTAFSEIDEEGFRYPCYLPRIAGTIISNDSVSMAIFKTAYAPIQSSTNGRHNRPREVLGYVVSNGNTSLTKRVFSTGVHTDDNDTYQDMQFFSNLFSDNPDDFIHAFSETDRMDRIRSSYYSFFLRRSGDDKPCEMTYTSKYSHGDLCFVGENVASMAAYRPDINQNASAFFVQKDANSDAFRLKMVQPVLLSQGDGIEFGHKVTDFGVQVPATQIFQATLYGRPCVYWMETAGETDDGKNRLFRVRAVWYDDVSNTVSEPYTIATVKTSAGSSPRDLILGDGKTGYYLLSDSNGKMTAYRFTFHLVPGIRMVGNLLTETLVSPGVYDDMVLTVYNNGNIPLSGLDLVAYDQPEHGSATAFETIHLDVLHPENNRVTLNKGLEGSMKEKQGQAVARQEESSLNVSGANWWLVKKETFRGTIKVSSNSSLHKTDLIMPGTFAAFNISMLLPQNWKDEHSFYLQVERFYTTSDNSFSGASASGQPRFMIRAAAAGSGTVSDSGTGNGSFMLTGEPEIISIGRDGTVRNESGGLQMFTAGDGTDDALSYTSMYKSEVTFDSVKLYDEHNDLEIVSRRWDSSDGVPMVTLTVTNRNYIGNEARKSNMVVMEAFLDDETTPVFRYSLPEEVSDTESWNFDLPLSLLTGGRSAEKVTVKVSGKDYVEIGEFDNKTEIWLDPLPPDPETTEKPIPVTGDDSAPFLWMAFVILSMAGIAFIIILRKKDKHEKTD